MRSKPHDKLLLTLAAITELDELEDQEDIKLADRAMREMRRDGVKAIPLDVLIQSIDRKIAVNQA